LFAYNRWADRLVLDACRQLSPEQYAAEPIPGWSSVRASVVHITSATQNWIRRIAGEEDSRALTENNLPGVEDAGRRLNHANQRLHSPSTALHPQQLAPPRTFQLRGRSLVLPPWVVLRHVVNRATYHRGQVASKLNRLGVQQPDTDIVFWAREQVPQQA